MVDIGLELENYRAELERKGYGKALVSQRLAQRCAELEAERDGAAVAAPLVKAVAEDVAQGKPALRQPTLLRGKAQGIPFRYQGDPPEQVVKDFGVIFAMAEGYLDGSFPGWPGTLLHGPLSRGKTSAAIEVMKQFAAAGWSGLFTTTYDLVATIKECWRPEPDRTELEAMKDFTRPAILVVDDVGVQFSTLAERNVLYSVVVGRYNACLPTMLTSNCDLDTDAGRAEFYEAAGRRVASRFESHVMGCAGMKVILRGKA